MGKIENSVTPLNSHLVKFDKPKMGIIDSFLEEVHGIILSEYSFTDNEGKIQFGTIRTILIGEELDPMWQIDSFSDSTFIHFFRNFPELSAYDIRKIIESIDHVRGFSEAFEDLKNAGCYTRMKGMVIEAYLREYRTVNGNRYGFLIPNIALLYTYEKWIPASLLQLFSLQEFMGCKFHLNGDNELQATVEQMNELLENHRQHEVMVVKCEGTVTCVNDGVYTYHPNGLKEKQTREEFQHRYPRYTKYED